MKVLDFGIAKIVSTGVSEKDPSAPGEGYASTRTGVLLGTPCYMSPEQARGRKELDARTDLWSLAIIAFECLVGRRPFVATVLGDLVVQICADPIPRPSEVGPVPEGFDGWFEHATQREPFARFQTVREAATTLASVLTPGQPWLEVAPEAEPATQGSPPKQQEALLTTESASSMEAGRGVTSTRTRAHGPTTAAGSSRALLGAAFGVLALSAVGLGLMRRGATAPGSAASAVGPPPPVDPVPSAAVGRAVEAPSSAASVPAPAASAPAASARAAPIAVPRPTKSRPSPVPRPSAPPPALPSTDTMR